MNPVQLVTMVTFQLLISSSKAPAPLNILLISATLLVFQLLILP